MATMYHYQLGRTIEVSDDQAVIDAHTHDGYKPATRVIHTATGLETWINRSGTVNSGRGLEYAMVKERLIGTQTARNRRVHAESECVPVFMLPRDWERISEADRQRIYLVTPPVKHAVPQTDKPKGGARS